MNEGIEKFSQELVENSEKKTKKRIKKHKSMSYNISKFNIHSSSFTKFKSVYERPNSEMMLRSSPKKKVKRNVSHPTNYFRDVKKRINSSELKLNVE